MLADVEVGKVEQKEGREGGVGIISGDFPRRRRMRVSGF